MLKCLKKERGEGSNDGLKLGKARWHLEMHAEVRGGGVGKEWGGATGGSRGYVLTEGGFFCSVERLRRPAWPEGEAPLRKPSAGGWGGRGV